MAFTVSLSQSWFLQAPITTGATAAPGSALNPNLKVTVYPHWYNNVTLTWQVPTSWGQCSFHVYFWEGGQEGYKRLTTNPVSDPSYVDPTAQDYSKFRNGYYIVEALLPGGQKAKSTPTSWHYKRRDRLERIASEVQRREYLLLSKFNGVKSYLFRRKEHGLRCPRCWSESAEKVMDDHCEVCFGTSFEGGYYDPLPLYINYDPTPNDVMKSYVGKVEGNLIAGYTISLPEISADDIIIRMGDWNVYFVAKIQSTEIQSNTVRQLLSLSQMAKSDVENKLTYRIEAAGSSQYLENLGGEFSQQRFPRAPVTTTQNDDPDWSKDQNLDVLPKYAI